MYTHTHIYMHVCMYIYTHLYLYLYLKPHLRGSLLSVGERVRAHVVGYVGLHTILSSPILYGVWHTKGGSVAGRILRNGRAIVLQWGRLCRWGGGNKRMIDSHNKALSETLSGKGSC